MKKEIIINASKDRSRIAIVEDGKLAELYVENPDNVRTLGNIYLARIRKVMPAIRAAFVDIGQKQDAFLHFSDLTENLPALLALVGEDVPTAARHTLATAPKKRVADDESEPDVEEKLELSDPEAARRARPARSRSRSPQRPRREEEEEQEEPTPPRRSPYVIDLTFKPGRVEPPKPKPAEAAPVRAESPAPEAAPSETPAAGTPTNGSESESAPPRRSRRKREEPAATQPPEEEASPAATADAPALEATPTEESRPAPRRSRGRQRPEPSGELFEEAPASTEAASPDEIPTSAPAGEGDLVTADEEDDASGGDAPRRRRRRGGRRRRRGGASEDIPAEGEAESPVVDVPAPEPASELPTAEPPAEPTPVAKAGQAKPARQQGRRKAASAEAPPEAPEIPPAAAPTEKPAAAARKAAVKSADAQRKPRAKAEPGKAAEKEPKAAPAARPKAEPKGRMHATSKPEGMGVFTGRAEDLLRRDGLILVKIVKEPISNKGSRVSTDISLAGRFLVLVPAADYVAVSKKIASSRERRRLRTLAQSLKPEGFGVIVRTVAEGRDAKTLDTDLRLLVDKWRKIEKQLKGPERVKPPALLYEDVSMVSSIIRDLFTDDYDRILVDDPKLHKNLKAYVQAVAPHMAESVVLHKAPTPVFRAAGLEKAVEEAFSQRVSLPSGGYLFIEHTEAMHVVDVNSGRAGKGMSQSENLLNVNLEAAREVAKQLRLRDLGGIIVVDFIDMRHESDQRKVFMELRKEFQKDRAVTKVLPMSEFGIVQITRQWLRPSITATAKEGLDPAEAARLAGAAEIPQPERATEVEAAAPETVTPEELAHRIEGWLRAYRANVPEKYRDRLVRVRVHPLLAAYLRRGFPSRLTRWKFALRGVRFTVDEDPAVSPLAFDVRDEKSGTSLLKKYQPA